MFLHKNLEALAIAAILPIRNGVADAVKKRAAAEVKPAYQQAAEMAEMANLVVA